MEAHQRFLGTDHPTMTKMGENMTLVDEYLRAIERLLPRDQREDIITELRDIVLSRIEAREAELGRALSEDEIEQELRKVGHPLVVAARYREGPQSVVSPALYPYWTFAVRVGATIAAIVALIVLAVVLIQTGDLGEALGRGVGEAVSLVVAVVGVVTLAAWAAERFGGERYLERWRVRDLKYLGLDIWDPDAWARWFSADRRGKGEEARTAWRARRGALREEMRALRRHRRRSPTAEAIVGLVVITLVVLWWIGIIHPFAVGDVEELRAAGVDPGALASVDWGLLKAMVFWPVLGYCALVFAQCAAVLAAPRARWLTGLFDIAIGASVLFFIAWIWNVSPLTPAVRVDSAAELIVRLRGSITAAGVSIAPFVTLAIAFATFGGVWRLVRGLIRLIPARPGEAECAPA
jgi:hypothetical protein